MFKANLKPAKKKSNKKQLIEKQLTTTRLAKAVTVSG
jgi:hypothetical protein